MPTCSALHAQRRSQRRIARELQIDRETVRKYLRARLSGSKPAIAPTGLEAGLAEETAGLAGMVEAAAAPLAASGPLSRWEPYREIIQLKIEAELSAKRIGQSTYPAD
jgi:hypothetical protein